MTTDLAPIEQHPGLPTKQELDDTVSRATEMAQTLAKIIDEQKLAVKIGGGKHVQVEAWQTVGRFCGYVAQSEEVASDEAGAKAIARITRLSDGMVVSTATARCGGPGDEPWDKRSSNHQSSMAQTRAVGKAFRNVLSWIVVLAGYEATPAEEMPKTPDAPAGPVCPEHGVEFFKKGRMRGFAHKIEGTDRWCNMQEDSGPIAPPADIVDPEGGEPLFEAPGDLSQDFPPVPERLLSEQFKAYGVTNLGWTAEEADKKITEGLDWLKDQPTEKKLTLRDVMLTHVSRVQS